MAMTNNLQITNKNNIITAIAPNIPSSSQITENIISLCASGINPSFCILFPKPLPKSPPDAIAYKPCRI